MLTKQLPGEEAGGEEEVLRIQDQLGVLMFKDQQVAEAGEQLEEVQGQELTPAPMAVPIMLKH